MQVELNLLYLKSESFGDVPFCIACTKPNHNGGDFFVGFDEIDMIVFNVEALSWH